VVLKIVSSARTWPVQPGAVWCHTWQRLCCSGSLRWCKVGRRASHGCDTTLCGCISSIPRWGFWIFSCSAVPS
jgi:hypothetical protein